MTSVLDDAKAYANHAKKKGIDLDDVKLAVSMQMEQSFTSPPPREVIFSLPTNVLLFNIENFINYIVDSHGSGKIKKQYTITLSQATLWYTLTT